MCSIFELLLRLSMTFCASSSFSDDRCVPVPIVAHARHDSVNALPGSVVTYTCDLGYSFSSDVTATITCSGGQWSDVEASCQRKPLLQPSSFFLAHKQSSCNQAPIKKLCPCFSNCFSCNVSERAHHRERRHVGHVDGLPVHAALHVRTWLPDWRIAER